MTESIEENVYYTELRMNWNEIVKTPHIIECAWNEWYKKFDMSRDDYYVNLFRKFIMNETINLSKNEKTIIVIENDKLILKSLDGFERKNIHKLCDKMGLHHLSVVHPKKSSKKFLHIIKPSIWKWEFSESNPYSESPEYYKQKEIESEQRREKYDNRRKNTFCDYCGENGFDSELFQSVYIRGIYCQDCLDNVSDGDGGILDDHKFEPCFM